MARRACAALALLLLALAGAHAADKLKITILVRGPCARLPIALHPTPVPLSALEALPHHP